MSTRDAAALLARLRNPIVSKELFSISINDQHHSVFEYLAGVKLDLPGLQRLEATVHNDCSELFAAAIRQGTRFTNIHDYSHSASVCRALAACADPTALQECDTSADVEELVAVLQHCTSINTFDVSAVDEMDEEIYTALAQLPSLQSFSSSVFETTECALMLPLLRSRALLSLVLLIDLEPDARDDDDHDEEEEEATAADDDDDDHPGGDDTVVKVRSADSKDVINTVAQGSVAIIASALAASSLTSLDLAIDLGHVDLLCHALQHTTSLVSTSVSLSWPHLPVKSQQWRAGVRLLCAVPSLVSLQLDGFDRVVSVADATRLADMLSLAPNLRTFGFSAHQVPDECLSVLGAASAMRRLTALTINDSGTCDVTALLEQLLPANTSIVRLGLSVIVPAMADALQSCFQSSGCSLSRVSGHADADTVIQLLAVRPTTLLAMGCTVNDLSSTNLQSVVNAICAHPTLTFVYCRHWQEDQLACLTAGLLSVQHQTAIVDVQTDEPYPALSAVLDITKDRRRLYQCAWQRVVAVIGFVRANSDSAIRYSIIQVVHGIIELAYAPVAERLFELKSDVHRSTLSLSEFTHTSYFSSLLSSGGLSVTPMRATAGGIEAPMSSLGKRSRDRECE